VDLTGCFKRTAQGGDTSTTWPWLRKTAPTGDYHYFYGLFLKKNGRKDNALYHLGEALKLLGRDPEKSRRVQKEIDSLKKGQDAPDSPSSSAKRWGASRRM
jgi:hypothetical protein